MAQSLNESVPAKLGNCFEVVNEEKKTAKGSAAVWQNDKYILVHVRHADLDEDISWLFTAKEFASLTNVFITKTLGKYLDKGKLYVLTIGKCSRYLVKVQNLKGDEIVISVGARKGTELSNRASNHPQSIVKLKKSLFGLFG